MVGFEEYSCAELACDLKCRPEYAQRVVAVMQMWKSVCFNAAAGVYVFPRARIAGRLVTVYPVEHEMYASNADFVLRRCAIPLVSGHAVRFGLSLGCTLRPEQNLFLDFSGAREDGTQPFMGLARHGNAERVYFDRNTAISADMFKVPDAACAFFEASDWVEVAIPRGALSGIAGHVSGLGV